MTYNEAEFPNRKAIMNTVREQVKQASQRELKEAFIIQAVEFHLNFGKPGWREFIRKRWMLREFAGMKIPPPEEQREIAGE